MKVALLHLWRKNAQKQLRKKRNEDLFSWIGRNCQQLYWHTRCKKVNNFIICIFYKFYRLISSLETVMEMSPAVVESSCSDHKGSELTAQFSCATCMNHSAPTTDCLFYVRAHEGHTVRSKKHSLMILRGVIQNSWVFIEYGSSKTVCLEPWLGMEAAVLIDCHNRIIKDYRSSPSQTGTTSRFTTIHY